VRVDELQGTITDLMKKVWDNLPPLAGAGVRPPVQGKKGLTSPSRDDSTSLSCVGRKGISNYCIYLFSGT